MEDLYSIHDVIRGSIDNMLMDLHTSIPARVRSYDSDKQTVTVTIAVNRPREIGKNIPAGTYHDIPVVFPAGGKWVMAGPLEVDDIVQLIVPHYGTEDFMAGSRNKVGDATTVKRHELNDAVAIPGMHTSNSVTRKEAHKDVFHLANGDSSVIVINENDITVQVGSSIFKVSASGIEFTGNLTINGNITSTGIVQGATVQTPTVGLATHVHTYVDNPSAAVVPTTVGLG